MTVAEWVSEVVKEAAEAQAHLEAAGAAFRRLTEAQHALAQAGRDAGTNDTTRRDAQPDARGLLDTELRRLGLLPVQAAVSSDRTMAESVRHWAERFAASVER